MIDNDMIHKLTRLINKGTNPVNENNVKTLVEINTKSVSYGRNMKLDKINLIDVRFISKIIGYKINYSSRVNSILPRFIHVAYMMILGNEKVNICKIFRQRLVDNLDRIKKNKNATLRFESLFTYLFFQIIRKFCGMPSYEWDTNKRIMDLITYHVIK